MDHKANLESLSRQYKAIGELAEKVREDRNQAIFDALDSGMTQREVAEATGLGLSRINQIALQRRT